MVKFHLKIENVVAFAVLNRKIPLTKLVERMGNTEYEPEQFPGLVYRISEPRASALIFSSGKIVCTGAKTVELAKKAMKRVVDDIRKAGVAMPERFRVVIENIVCSTKIDVKPKLMLEEIAISMDEVEYDPERFPGLVYRMRDPRIVFLLFGSGKIICTGGRSLNDVHKALGKLKKRLEGLGLKIKPVA